MTAQRFIAPWSGLLVGLTTAGSAIILGAAIAAGSDDHWMLFGGLASIWAYCVAGHIRAYDVAEQQLRIQRLLYRHTLDLSRLKHAERAPRLLRGAVRIGNGGLFSFSGWFFTRPHGWVRGVATDSGDRCVLLTFDDSRWAVSPDDPAGFVDTVLRAAGLDD